MKIGVSGAIGIIFTGGISLYLYKKFQALHSEMVSKAKIGKADTNTKAKADDNDNTPSAVSNGYTMKTNNTELKNGVSKVERDCNINELNGSNDVTNENFAPTKTSDDDFIVDEHLASFGNTKFLENTFANENCGLDQVITVQVPYDIKDDYSGNISPSSYEELNQQDVSPSEGHGHSDVSSYCSSISPVSDLTLLSLKLDEQNCETMDNIQQTENHSIDAQSTTVNQVNLNLNLEAEVTQASNSCESNHGAEVSQADNNLDSVNSFRVDAEEFHPKTSFATPVEPAAVASETNDEQINTQEVNNVEEYGQFLIFEDKQPSEEDFLKLYAENLVSCVIAIPNEYVGKLLGKKGKFVQKIKNDTGIILNLDKVVNNGHKSCYMQGPDSKLCQALDMIEKLFPRDSFPNMADILNDVELVTMPPQNTVTVGLQNPDYRALDTLVPVKVTGISTVNCLYLQILNHPLYPQLASIQATLKTIYEKYQIPNIPFPCAVGSLCVGYFAQEWHRCEVVECKASTVVVLLVDSGCTIELESSQLKLLLNCLAEIPFFAAQVFLNAIQVPPNEDTMAAGNDWLGQIVSKYNMYANLVGRDMAETPIVQLFSLKEDQNIYLVNAELINMGFAHHHVINTMVTNGI